MSPYGMTFKQVAEFSDRLAERLDVEPDRVKKALAEITREDVNIIAKNEIKEDQ